MNDTIFALKALKQAEQAATEARIRAELTAIFDTIRAAPVESATVSFWPAYDTIVGLRVPADGDVPTVGHPWSGGESSPAEKAMLAERSLIRVRLVRAGHPSGTSGCELLVSLCCGGGREAWNEHIGVAEEDVPLGGDAVAAFFVHHGLGEHWRAACLAYVGKHEADTEAAVKLASTELRQRWSVAKLAAAKVRAVFSGDPVAMAALDALAVPVAP